MEKRSRECCPCLYPFHKDFITLKQNCLPKLDSYVLSLKCTSEQMVYRDIQVFINHCNAAGDWNHTIISEYLTKRYDFDQKDSRKKGKIRR